MSEPLDKPVAATQPTGKEPVGDAEKPVATDESKPVAAVEKPDASNTTTPTAEGGNQGATQSPQVTSPPTAGEEKKEEKPSGKAGRLSDEDKQTIYGLLHQGQSQSFVLKIYGSGKNDTVGKMAEELKTGRKRNGVSLQPK